MKKSTTVLILLLTFNLMKSQSVYHKMLGDTNRWFVSGFVYAVKVMPSQNTSALGAPCLSYYNATKDSVYMGKYYKVFKIESPITYLWVSNTNSFFESALVREDTIQRKVYLVHPDSINESVCMDFIMNVGDSIYLPFHSQSYVLKNGYYKLDSIIPIQEVQGIRSHYYLHKHDAPINFYTNKQHFIEWIESIGATHFPINIVAEDASYAPISFYCKKNQYASFITCKFTNHQKYYQDSCALKFTKSGLTPNYFYQGDDCEFFGAGLGAFHNISFTNNLNIYPNPIIDKEIYIEFEAMEFNPIDITIYNVLGDFIYSKHFNIVTSNNKITIPNLHLTSGLYNLQLSTSKETSSYKIIKE